jgi:hypothetical protein
LLSLWLLPTHISHGHPLEARGIEHHTQNSIGTHDHSGRNFAGLGTGFFFHVDLERANATLFPFLVCEMEEFGFAGKICFLLFLSSFN